MTIRFKLLCMQGIVLLMTFLLLGTFLFVFNTVITPLTNRLDQDIDALSQMNAEEKLTSTMIYSRRDMHQATATYIHAPTEFTKTKYDFAAQKLKLAINNTIRDPEQGAMASNISVVESNIEDVERNMFRFVQQGDVKRARALLGSADYEVLRENYDTFIQQLTNRNKARARDQFSKLVFLSSGIKAGGKQLSELIPIVFLSSISIILIAFTVSFVVSWSISRPLKQLTQGAEIIGSGNFEHKIALRGKDEISDLSRAFDSMTERLRTTTVSRDALLQEVAERKRVEDLLQNKNFELERLLVEHQRTEMALRASEALLDRFVAEAPVGLVVFDADRRLLRTNKTFCELTGYPKGELLGHTSAFYTHPEDLPATLTLTDQFYRGERDAYTYETRCVRKSGEIIWVSVNAIRMELLDHPGPVQLAVVQDITEQKRAMEEREQLSQDLHDDLLQSLYAVGMQLEACRLAIRTSPLKSKAHLTYSIDQLNYQVRAIRQFIALLKQPIRTKPSFTQALRQLIVSFSAAGQAAATLELDDSVLACINATQGEHLLKIAQEALSNSMRHAQATQRGVRFNHTGDMIRMVIWDNGVGLASRQRHRRGDGLRNMSARAEKIRARLTLDSTPGQGTRVTVDVPRESRDGHA